MSFTHFDELQITLSSLVGYTCQVRVSLLAVFSNDGAVIERVLLQEALRRVVAVNVNFGQCIVGSWLLTPLVDTGLQPW